MTCERCGRPNPPNRRACIYCGEGLPIPAERLGDITPNFRKLETWERGFNLIWREQTAEVKTPRAAEFLSIESDHLAEILHAGPGLPVARVATATEAEVLMHSLEGAGLRCSLVPDEDLDADMPPVRIGGVEFLNYQLAIKNFNTGEISLAAYDQVVLIVRGQITRSRVDANEKKRRRGTNPKVIDEYATVSDESVIDIYTKADNVGFRIYPAGFDFSCLGDQKTLLARENVGRLVDWLTEHSPTARLVSNYPQVHHALSHVWEVESRKDSLGLRQIAIGKREFGSVASTSNLSQFTKFSRLQWHLL